MSGFYAIQILDDETGLWKEVDRLDDLDRNNLVENKFLWFKWKTPAVLSLAEMRKKAREKALVVLQENNHVRIVECQYYSEGNGYYVVGVLWKDGGWL